MSTPLDTVPIGDLFAELKRRMDAVVLIYCYRADPTDEVDQKEQFRLYTSDSFTACTGLLERARTAFKVHEGRCFPGWNISEAEDEDDGEEQPEVPA